MEEKIPLVLSDEGNIILDESGDIPKEEESWAVVASWEEKNLCRSEA